MTEEKKEDPEFVPSDMLFGESSLGGKESYGKLPNHTFSTPDTKSPLASDEPSLFKCESLLV